MLLAVYLHVAALPNISLHNISIHAIMPLYAGQKMYIAVIWNLTRCNWYHLIVMCPCVRVCVYQEVSGSRLDLDSLVTIMRHGAGWKQQRCVCSIGSLVDVWCKSKIETGAHDEDSEGEGEGA